MKYLIEVNRVSHQYVIGNNTIESLREISFSVREGEFIAIVGANGSGKSTLARMINATLLPNEGWVKVDGLDTKDRSQHAKIRSTVGMVFQYPQEQIIGSTVEEDIAFGVEQLGLSEMESQKLIEEALRKVGLWEQRKRAINMLSAGQIQRVAFAGVLARKPRVMILDETTSMLDPLSRRQVFSFMKQLNQEGITILYITHDMEEAVQADRVIGLFEGRLVFDASPKHAFSYYDGLFRYHLMPTLAQRLTHSLKPYFPSIKQEMLTIEELVLELCRLVPLEHRKNGRIKELNGTSSGKAAANLANPSIQVEQLGFTYYPDTPLATKALEGISILIPRGGAHALIGGTGSGKSTLLQHVNALLRPQHGMIIVEGMDLTQPDLDVKLLRRRVGYAFQTPEEYFFEQYVGDEIAYKAKRYGVKDKNTLREEVASALSKVGLDFELYKDRMTFGLSGGERRKVALASVFVLDPAVIVLDEPTAGLDPFSQKELLQQLHLLIKEGKTLLFATHAMEDAAYLADTCTVMKNGRQIANGLVEEVLTDEYALTRGELLPPLITQLIKLLNNQGWEIPHSIIREDELIQTISHLTLDK